MRDMIADRLITNIGALVTAGGVGAVRGRAMQALQITPDAAIAIAGARIVWCGAHRDWSGSATVEQDVHGCAVVPGLIDPHTHLVWGGDRYADFEARASGVSYETILARGGGIRHTVACTRQDDLAALVNAARPRLARLQRSGATTIEIKSGYGLEFATERRQLEAVRALASLTNAQLLPTMLFHLPPRDPVEREGFMRDAIREWIPAIARDGIATAIDVFVERDAFTVAEADALLTAATAAGLSRKLHADQFSAIGGTELAIRHGALSVDHLEASGAAQIQALAASQTVGTILPGVTLHLGLPAAPGRALIDAGAIVAVGTDCNPGSSPLFSMSLAMALAVRLNGLTAAEALTATTANAAAALGLSNVGRIAPGMRADLLLLRAPDWRELPYALGDDVIASVIIAGEELIHA